MLNHLSTLYRYRDLLWLWTVREIKVRYKQSLLGGAWAVLQPVSLMVIFTVVFSLFVRIPTDGQPYPVFVYTALLPWTFFVTSVSLGVPSLVNNMTLVTKIYFPREILPMASILAGLLDFALGLVVFLPLLLFFNIPLSWNLVWLPIILLIQIAFTIGVTLWAAAVNVFYRDIRFVIPLALQLWLYSTPVIYPLNVVPETLRPIYLLNPMVGIIDNYRRVLLLGTAPDPLSLLLAAVLALAVASLAYVYFKRVEWLFADMV